MNKKEKIVKIEFVLENCEVISADIKKCWNNIQFGKCFKSYSVQFDCNDTGSTLFEHEFTDYCKVTLELKDFHPQNTNFAGKDGEVQTEQESYKRLIEGRDVTSICLIFEDGTEQQIIVPYKGEFTNKVQYFVKRKAHDGDDILDIYFDYNYYWHRIQHWFYMKYQNILYFFKEIKTKRRIKKAKKEQENANQDI